MFFPLVDEKNNAKLPTSEAHVLFIQANFHWGPQQWTEDTNLGTFLSEIFSHRMRALAETVSSCCRIKQHSLEFPLWLSLDHTVLIEKKILLASQATNRSYSPLENYNSITYQTQYSSWSMMHCSHLSGIRILTLGSISIPQFSTNACHCYPTTIPLNG